MSIKEGNKELLTGRNVIIALKDGRGEKIYNRKRKIKTAMDLYKKLYSEKEGKIKPKGTDITKIIEKDQVNEEKRF